ncbi:MAG: hypothetical protein F6K26_08640 [Moorea sp. SIO2I5]|nr:hypothetical protein [Moorena sp. SIO2I5]
MHYAQPKAIGRRPRYAIAFGAAKLIGGAAPKAIAKEMQRIFLIPAIGFRGFV